MADQAFICSRCMAVFMAAEPGGTAYLRPGWEGPVPLGFFELGDGGWYADLCRGCDSHHDEWLAAVMVDGPFIG